MSKAHSKHKPHASHLTHSTHAKRVAFTLAEVLITLAIIGIVAAMTIPTLVANYQTRAWSTSASVFERKLEEALRQMNTQQVLAGYRSTADFVAELSKYFKINRVCNSNEITSCFTDKINWKIVDLDKNTESDTIDISTIKTAADLGQEDWGTEAIGVQFANGTTGIIAYNPNCRENPYTNQFTGTSCISLVYDTDGFKKPNTYLKDIHGINTKLVGCAFKMDGMCFGEAFFPEFLTKTECESLKDDLDIKGCVYDEDYWAGAVKACGGTGKMPTREQLTKIAMYVYNTTEIKNQGQTYNVTLDIDKVAALGIKTNADTIQLWSGDEFSSNNATYRYFSDDSTGGYNNPNRTASYKQAICIID